MNTRPEGPLDHWATTEVLAAVIDAEMARFLGEGPTKEQALVALAARRELEDRMRRHRWLAIETARRAGATWPEIAAAVGVTAPEARRLYERTLAGQKAMGLADPQRRDPGVPEL